MSDLLFLHKEPVISLEYARTCDTPYKQRVNVYICLYKQKIRNYMKMSNLSYVLDGTVYRALWVLIPIFSLRYTNSRFTEARCTGVHCTFFETLNDIISI